MIFNVYGTVYSGDDLATRQVNTDHQSAGNRAAYAKVFAEPNTEFNDPNTTGEKVIFNVREVTNSAAAVVIAVENQASVVAFILSGREPAADKALVDGIMQKAFKHGGEPEHAVVNIQPPACYSVIRDISNGSHVSEAVIGGLMLHAENVAAAFFRRLGMCQ